MSKFRSVGGASLAGPGIGQRIFGYRGRGRFFSRSQRIPFSRRHVDASLDLFARKKPTKLERFSREESSQRAPPFFLWMVGV